MDQIKQACVSLAQVALVPQTSFDPRSQAVIGKLKDLLQQVENYRSQGHTVTHDLADYIYFPIHHLLQKEALGDRQTEYILLLLTQLFETGWKDSLSLDRASQLVAVTAYLVSPDQMGENTEFRKKSSEVHAAAFKCVNAIFLAAHASGIADKLGSQPAILQIVYTLLDGLQYDDALASQLAALTALDSLLKYMVTLPDYRAKLLPGISSKLVNFVEGHYGKRHYKAKAQAVLVYAQVIVGALSDLFGESSIRNSEWIAETDAQINNSLSGIYKQITETRYPELLNAGFDFAKQVASDCLNTLTLSGPTLVDMILYCASQKRDEPVRLLAWEFLTSKETTPVFATQLEKRSLSLLDVLPSTFTSHDEHKPILALDALRVSLDFSKSAVLPQYLIESLENSLSLVQSNKQTLDTGGSSKALVLSDIGVSSALSPASEHALVDLLHQVGSLNGEQILTSLFERLQSSPNPLGQVQLIWIAMNVFDGYAKSGHASPDLIYDYLDFSYGVVSRAGSLSSNENPSLLGLSLYFIGNLSQMMGIEFTDQLVDALYPVVNLLGHPNPMVVHQAQMALGAIAKACDYHSVEELVLANKDYVIDGVSQKLNTMDISPATPLMLSTLIRMAGPSIVPYLDDLVASIFVILDNYHGYSMLVGGIFDVFATIVKVMARSQPLLLKERPKNEFLHFNTFEEMMAELRRKPEIDPTILDPPKDEPKDEASEETARDSDDEDSIPEPNESDDDIDEPMQDEEEWASSVPKSSYMIVDKIFGYGDRFLTHSSPYLRYNILELLRTSLPLLATSDKEFLPNVHKLWPVLAARVNDPELFVVESALKCIGELCRYAGDFMSARINLFWPTLADKYGKDLRRQWPDHSPEKRQLDALAYCVNLIVEYTPLNPQTTDSIVAAFAPALKRGEYSALKETIAKQHRGLLRALVDSAKN